MKTERVEITGFVKPEDGTVGISNSLEQRERRQQLRGTVGSLGRLCLRPGACWAVPVRNREECGWCG